MPALAIHGGCGVPPPGSLSDARSDAIRGGLQTALAAGWRLLEAGASALDAVEAAVVALEEDPCFNAGRGAVLNAAGEHELDAAIMDGRDLSAGAVAGIRRVRNPVRLARAVMQHTEHVLLIGAGAEQLAAERGLELVAPDWFTTPERLEALARMLQRQRQGTAALAGQHLKHGTVGAVACDRAGNLAAATSTGGYTAKLPGRVGDTPLIGAGTYANNASLAVSGTGRGEIFIRSVAAHELHARIAYRGQSLSEACTGLVQGQLAELGGGAGLIAVDRSGNIAMPFNTAGMYRASISDSAPASVAIY